jgi:hypothetical protein
MKIFTLIGMLVLVFLLSGNERVCAQVSASDNTPEAFKLSFSDRLRIETYDNTVTLSKAAKAGSSYARNRINLTGQWFPSGSLEFAATVSNEFRNYFSPSTNDFYMNEVYFDQLYLKWKTKSIAEGVLTLGRQNITLGEGFVVMEGTPLDGSRSVYFNAARYDWSIVPGHLLTAFYTYQPKIDKLPVLNGRDIDPAFQGDGSWNLVEQTEAGGGLYYTAKMSALDLQAYAIRKDYLDPDVKAGQFKSGINTAGSRMNAVIDKNFSAAVEAAYQFGRSGDARKNAYGGYAYVNYAPLSPSKMLPKKITLGTICLSGDDRSTKNDEGWDPIFSRWPKWSDSYVNTLIKEFNGRPAYWSNLISLYASTQFSLDEQADLILTYHHMAAPEASAATAFLSGNGRTRGDLLIAKLLFTVSRTVSGHVIIEHFIPGNYYFKNANVGNWARIEFLFRI